MNFGESRAKCFFILNFCNRVLLQIKPNEVFHFANFFRNQFNQVIIKEKVDDLNIGAKLSRYLLHLIFVQIYVLQYFHFAEKLRNKFQFIYFKMQFLKLLKCF
jgi:hypothetical protein